MTNNSPELASAAVSGAAAAMAAGRPAEEVIVWSVFGAVVAVWINSRNVGAVNARWIVNAALMLVVSVMCGIVGSSMFMALAPEYALTQPLSRVPQWTAAFAIAATIHVVAPLAYNFVARWSRRQETRSDGTT